MVEFGEALYLYFWTPWVWFLERLGGTQTAAMAVPATIAMLIMGAFIYIPLRYIIVARIAEAADIPEKTLYRAAMITTIGIVFLMGYTGAILFIAPLFTTLVTFIGIAFIFIAFFAVWGLSKRGWAITKGIEAETAEMEMEAKRVEKRVKEQEATLAEEAEQAKEEEEDIRDLEKDIENIEKDVSDNARTDGEVLAEIDGLKRTLAAIQEELNRGSNTIGPAQAPTMKATGDKLLEFKKIKEARDKRIRTTAADIDRLEKDAKAHEENLNNLKERFEKEIKDTGRDLKVDFNDYKKLMKDLPETIKKIKDEAERKHLMDVEYANAKDLQRDIQGLMSQLNAIKAVESDITKRIEAHKKEADPYLKAEKAEIKRFNAELDNLAKRSDKAAESVYKAINEMIAKIADPNTANKNKQRAVSLVDQKIDEFHKVLENEIAADKDFLAKQENFRRFLASSEAGIKAIEAEIIDLADKLETFRNWNRDLKLRIDEINKKIIGVLKKEGHEEAAGEVDIASNRPIRAQLKRLAAGKGTRADAARVKTYVKKNAHYIHTDGKTVYIATPMKPTGIRLQAQLNAALYSGKQLDNPKYKADKERAMKNMAAILRYGFAEP